MKPIVALSVLLLAGCSLLPNGDDEELRIPKAECDQYASQAIQTDDLESAKNLAARASECYASLQNQ